jgi:hypothetical protein
VYWFASKSRWLPKALPPLVGRTRWLFLIIWFASLAACLWAIIATIPYLYDKLTTTKTSPFYTVGFLIDQQAPWPTIGTVFKSDTGRTNLHRGDRVITIDGQAVGASTEAIEQQLSVPVGTTVTVMTRSTSGDLIRHVLTRDDSRYLRALAAVGLNPFLLRILGSGINFLFGSIMPLGCAILLMARRSRDPLAPWASLMMLWTVLELTYAGQILLSSLMAPDLAYEISSGVAMSMIVIVLAVFPTGRFDPTWSLAVATVGPLFIIAGPANGVLSNVVALLAQAMAVLVITLRYRRMTPGTGRQQIRWALLGFGAATIVLMVEIVIQSAEPRAESIGSFSWLMIGDYLCASVLTDLLMISITISLLRYRLYDADVVIDRSIVFGAVTLALLALFTGSEKVIEVLGEEYFGEQLGAFAGGLSAALAATMIVPVHHRVSHWAEKHFRSGLVHLRKGLPVLVGDMRETASPRMLAQAMLARVETGVKASQGAVVMGGDILDARDIDVGLVVQWLVDDGPDKTTFDGLKINRLDPLFPIQVPLRADGVGLVGWLLLGPRPDGSFYGRDEREALIEIADPVARALSIAATREAREASYARDINEVRLVVQRLQEYVGLGSTNNDRRVNNPTVC